MSGIVALVRMDGAPIETTSLERLVAAPSLHGPDAQHVWHDGPIGLGHAWLRSTDDAEADLQPLSFDGRTWIVADARVDARRDLIGRLPRDFDRRSSPSDAGLILQAYLKWGTRCVDHLLGDFAFVIWDATRRRLFAARDHLGVKPLYYAQVWPWLIVSSALDALRSHPGVSPRLNDLAIADFLLFGVNQDHATTSFRDIRRVPAAHTLTWTTAGLLARRYWTLPIEDPLYHNRDGAYFEQFDDLLRQAVSDRLRTDRVNVFMSGGLDSPALAATALALLGPRKSRDAVRAFTYVYDSLIPDDERRHAGAVARHLGIPVNFYPMDRAHGWTSSVAMRTPEPIGVRTDPGHDGGCLAAMAAHGRVAFHGEGPDNGLWYDWRPYLTHLIRTRQWCRLGTDLGRHLVSQRRVPLIPSLPRIVKARLSRKRFDPVFPQSIASELVDRLRLLDRWRDVNAPCRSPHPTRPDAYASLLDVRWQAIFEAFAPSYTGVDLEVRHPFLDIRMLRFFLRVPALPWCRAKYLMRQALRGVVPEAVRRRPKTPLTLDPDYEEIRRHGLPRAVPSPELAEFGNQALLSPTRPKSVWAVRADLRFVALSYWLRDYRSAPSMSRGEDVYERSEELVGARRG